MLYLFPLLPQFRVPSITCRTASSSSRAQDVAANSLNDIAMRRRNLQGIPDPETEVIALSSTSLLANRFVCEVCNKSFQREQYLQLHRRGHNLPWKLKDTQNDETVATKKNVYVCPESSCLHHHRSRALRDLTGIRKHFRRMHGDMKWKCDKCPRAYSIKSDLKSHSKRCLRTGYLCNCGTVFSRRDIFITHGKKCEEIPKKNPQNISPSPFAFPFIHLPQRPLNVNENVPVPSISNQNSIANNRYNTINYFTFNSQNISPSPSPFRPSFSHRSHFQSENRNPNPSHPLQKEVCIKQDALYTPLPCPPCNYLNHGKSSMSVEHVESHDHVGDGVTRDLLLLFSGSGDEEVRPELPSCAGELQLLP